ncbi:MAG: Holliday junction branch migration protein RuvA [Lachnospiraceae bacterium]|nr:Holliday junction branch migration protein RuvA [Lachnospiraceae bacterium]
MYSFIQGTLEDIELSEVTIMANNVGYRIAVPMTVMDELPALHEEIRLYTYLSVREDALQLFGFMSAEDRNLFKKLISVSGIGPKGGLAILSVLPPEELILAIFNGDDTAISKAPGIGKKTAQKLILELKDKLDYEGTINKTLDKGSKNEIAGLRQEINDAILALTSLGYSAGESKNAVSRVELTEGMKSNDILRKALQYLAF